MLKSKEDTIQLLQSLCSDPTGLLTDARKLATFNVFLASADLGFPLPVEFAVGSLLHHPLVVQGKLSPAASQELDLTWKLCANLLRCRQAMFASEKSKKSNDVTNLF